MIIRAKFFCLNCKMPYRTIVKRGYLFNESYGKAYVLKVQRVKAKCPKCADEMEQRVEK